MTQSRAMVGLSLLDAAALLFVVFRIVRARTRSLGESLHALIALLLLIGLFLGFRMTRELRAVLSEAADLLQAIPGLGTVLFDASIGRDLHVLLTVTALMTGAIMGVRALSDATLTWLDPRIR